MSLINVYYLVYLYYVSCMCVLRVCTQCSRRYLYLCQDRDVLLERNQGFSFDDSMSSHLHTQRVVQRWLQVCHVHPGPGHAITQSHANIMSGNNKNEQKETVLRSMFCSYLLKGLQGSSVLLVWTPVVTGGGFPERTTPGSLWRAYE